MASSFCVLCGDHVVTGEGYLLLQGDVARDGTFINATVKGLVCCDCVAAGDPKEPVRELKGDALRKAVFKVGPEP